MTQSHALYDVLESDAFESDVGEASAVVSGEASGVVWQVRSSNVGHVASVLLLISTCDTCKLAYPVLESPPPTLNVYGPE